MSKSIGLKNNIYLDDSFIVHKTSTNNRMLNTYFKDCQDLLMLFGTLGSDPNFDNYTALGVYPFYDGNFNLVDGTSDTIQWGCLIVLTYSPDWKIQIVIGGADFNQTNICKFFMRRINASSSGSLWNKIL